VARITKNIPEAGLRPTSQCWSARLVPGRLLDVIDDEYLSGSLGCIELETDLLLNRCVQCRRRGTAICWSWDLGR